MEEIVGIIVAAGRSRRFGEDKLLINLKGQPIVYYSIKKIDLIEKISRLILVVREEMVDNFGKMLSKWDIKKPIKIVVGGEERQNSVHNALRSIDFLCNYVLIHDAARPFVSLSKVKSLIDFCLKNRVSAVLGIPIKDTVKEISENKEVIKTLDRNKLWLIQTPQMFPYEIIMKAYDKAMRDGFVGTDDAVLVERISVPVYVVDGDPLNIKITTKEDLIWIEGISQRLELA